MKKTVFSLILALAGTCGAWANNWTMLPTFVGEKTQNVVDAGDKVYYLASNCLYCYDKETEENASLNRTNVLNDVSIKDIYYNDYKDYLMVVYDNANIDVITADGNVLNMPEINQASITDKKINHVTFTDQGEVYVATSFGYVVINDNKWEVKESHIYGQNVNSVAKMGNYIVLSIGNEIHFGKAGKHYDTIGSMPLATGLNNDNGRLYPITDTRMLVLTGWTLVVDCRFTDESLTLSLLNSSEDATTNVHRTPSGFLLNCFNNKCYYTLNHLGEELTRVDGGPEMYSAYSGGKGTLWSVGEKGLHNSDAKDSYYLPTALTMAVPYHLTINKFDHLLYISSTGTNGQISNQFAETAVNTFDGVSIKDVTPTPEVENGGTYCPLFTAANTYYMGSWWTGVLKVIDGKIVNTYNWENSPLVYKDNYYCHANIDIDNGGNLWAAQTGTDVGSNIFVLPKAKLDQPTVKASDWINVNLPDTKMSKRGIVRTLKNSTKKIVFTGNYKGMLTFFDDKGTPTSNPSSKAHASGSLFDNDGNLVEWRYIYAITEDQKGTIWMGTDQGVFTFYTDNALNNDFMLYRIKVPRNDGTNLADYLLNGIPVTAIATDASNRKWVGTEGSGLFLVSEDGTTVIHQFNTDNSPLLSNTIYNICCDPQSKAMYVTTANGMMRYEDASSPAEGDMSNVYAYPNPVRPDYYGPITITGLMDKCLVKIADVDGNVVKTMRSTGGTATWDGANAQGERVKSGIYFILASEGNSEGSASAVAKLMIIR